MEQQPSSSGKPVRSTPVWQPQLDRVEARIEAIAATVEQLDARVSDMAAGTTPGGSGGETGDEAMAEVRHELEMVSSRMADQALDGAVGREVLQRLEATLSGYAEAVSRVGESVESVRSMVEGLRTTSVANEVAISGLSGAVDELGDRLQSTQQRMIARTHIDEVRQRIERTEVALAHQANVIGNALRARIDDQRALSDELGAQVTNLSANIAWASDSPEQLRREVRQSIESLAQRVGVAMREVRTELAHTSSSKELTTGVDAGMARLSDRLRGDADRLAKVVADVHTDNDERLRRMAVQMTEMQRTIELLRWGQRVDQDLTDTEARLTPHGPRHDAAAAADQSDEAGQPDDDREPESGPAGEADVLRAEIVDPQDWLDDPAPASLAGVLDDEFDGSVPRDQVLEELAPVPSEAAGVDGDAEWGAIAPDESVLKQIRWPRRP